MCEPSCHEAEQQQVTRIMLYLGGLGIILNNPHRDEKEIHECVASKKLLQRRVGYLTKPEKQTDRDRNDEEFASYLHTSPEEQREHQKVRNCPGNFED
eukprot:CAMPEP_0194743976 /NCGR_PEP_ID=MMETSP0296-20130528/100608_1 /TAXON_ID=39354 /ORGANISM="Heterosigma akashiwo, Strain CCMP2393" /LENGTH=97 /DNA_ID=CAMNT_0039656057 /DNA_START=926 /DNA_END=1219 /DNA_ORIENTATION=+